MLQIEILREQPGLVLAGLAKKHYATAEADVAAILDLDSKRRDIELALLPKRKHLVMLKKSLERQGAKGRMTLLKNRQSYLE